MKPSIIFVLGTGRSGTSLLTRMLSLSGCSLPEALIPANFANPTGYWEGSDVVSVNERIFQRCGTVWYEPTFAVQERLNSDDQLREESIASIAGLLSGAVKDTPIILKDPRLSETLELWATAATRLGLTSSAILVTRNPREYIKSVQAVAERSGYTVPSDFPMLLWLKYSLLAERHSRILQRVVVGYANLLANWKLERQRISRSLDIFVSDSNDSLIESFVDPSLYRQRTIQDPFDPFPNGWLHRTFRALSDASNHDFVDEDILNDVFLELTSCERVFRLCTSHFASIISLPQSQLPSPLEGTSRTVQPPTLD